MTATSLLTQRNEAARRGRVVSILTALALMATAPMALAANVLQDIKYAAAPGGKVEISLQFSEPVGEVQAFTTDTPPRIAIDIPGASNGMSERRVVVGAGAASAVTAAEAAGRTRVVVELMRPAGYTTRSSGNMLILTVDAGAQAATASTAMATAADPSKRVAGALAVSNVDFRRGENGSGRVIVRFSGDGASVDMRQVGNQVIVDVANANIPDNLRRQMDVSDFATPVRTLEPNANAGAARLVINTQGSNDVMAYQTGNEYVVEVTPKRAVATTQTGPNRAAGAIGGAGSSQRYTGRPVTFNFQDIPVRTVLQLIAEESGLNVVAADTVGGNVTLRLVNVPWDQALEIVLRAKGLDKRRDGNVIWIAPQAELAAFEQAKEDARIALQTREELVTEYIPINYGNAEQIAKLLTEDSKTGQGQSGGGGGGGGSGPGQQQQQRGFLSPRGSVSFDTRTNTLLVVDIQKKVDEIRALLAVLDRPVDQVLIEARVVVASESFARDLGARFGVNERLSTAGDEGDPLNDAHDTSGGFDINLPVNPAAGTFNISILRSNWAIDLELSALEEEGRGDVVANPRVITSNQREAIITQGQEIGYITPTAQTGGAAIATPAFKEALLELKVTPTITSDGRVYLTVALKKDDVLDFIEGVPTLAKRSVSTAVLVDSGQTVVVGGVYEFSSREDIRRVPFLGELPILGNLFRNKSRQREKAELLILITPRVLQVSGRS